jgi:hypothetical protein
MARMNTALLRQRLWLWVLVHVGIRDCSPRQLLRYWRLVGILALVPGAIGVLGVVDGDDLAWLFVTIMVLLIVMSIVIIRAAAADLRSPLTIEGRVTGFQRLWIKGMNGNGSKRWQYRVALDEGTGSERLFRAADESNLSLSEGDLVRARVGARLRWIYHVEVVGSDRA